MLCEFMEEAAQIRTMKIKSYRELKNLETFEERFEYLKLGGGVGKSTFGFDRYLNQVFYRSREWQDVRKIVIIRDEGCDLGIFGREIPKGIIIHHMNPISIEQIEDRDPDIFNPDFLVCCSHNTHNAIHYSDSDILYKEPITRTKGDTTLWKHV